MKETKTFMNVRKKRTKIILHIWNNWSTPYLLCFLEWQSSQSTIGWTTSSLASQERWASALHWTTTFLAYRMYSFKGEKSVFSFYLLLLSDLFFLHFKFSFFVCFCRRFLSIFFVFGITLFLFRCFLFESLTLMLFCQVAMSEPTHKNDDTKWKIFSMSDKTLGKDPKYPNSLVS